MIMDNNNKKFKSGFEHSDTRALNSPAIRIKLETTQFLNILNDELIRIHEDRRNAGSDEDRAKWDALLEKVLNTLLSMISMDRAA